MKSNVSEDENKDIPSPSKTILPYLYGKLNDDNKNLWYSYKSIARADSTKTTNILVRSIIKKFN